MKIDRRRVQDAILAWRDGKTFDAIHPLANRPSEQVSAFWDDNAMKDLARVITAVVEGDLLTAKATAGFTATLSAAGVISVGAVQRATFTGTGSLSTAELP